MKICSAHTPAYSRIASSQVESPLKGHAPFVMTALCHSQQPSLIATVAERIITLYASINGSRAKIRHAQFVAVSGS